MQKLKGQGTLTKLITSRVAKLNRESFLRLIRQERQFNQLVTRISQPDSIVAEVVSFSSSKDYAEQVLSILSLLRYVGVPPLWTIYSDGSHTPQQIDQLAISLPFVRIVNQFSDKTYFENIALKADLLPYKQELIDFAQNHVLGKKLVSYLNHSITAPTFFLDSDVLFYKESSILKQFVEPERQNWFLPDKDWGCLDSRYTFVHSPDDYQVNTGFILMNTELDNVNSGLSFLKKIGRTYEYFSEQTVMHILLNTNQYKPLDSRLFIVDTVDQFDFSYAYIPNAIALRHYTGPVRHKMWQRDWQWHLSLT